MTNASRTMLMDLKSLAWDPEISRRHDRSDVDAAEIRSSAEVYGHVRAEACWPGVPIAGDLGDQQAATFGQACFEPGMAKNTYGTGNFMLMNTGEKLVLAKRPTHHRLLQDR